MSRTELSFYMINMLAIIIVILWIVTAVRTYRIWKADKAEAKDRIGKLIFKAIIWTIGIAVIIALLLRDEAFVSGVLS